jgi:hypothetical protein
MYTNLVYIIFNFSYKRNSYPWKLKQKIDIYEQKHIEINSFVLNI